MENIPYSYFKSWRHDPCKIRSVFMQGGGGGRRLALDSNITESCFLCTINNCVFSPTIQRVNN